MLRIVLCTAWSPADRIHPRPVRDANRRARASSCRMLLTRLREASACAAAPGEPLPEALAKLDPVLIENVCSEVMDSGGKLGERRQRPGPPRSCCSCSRGRGVGTAEMHGGILCEPPPPPRGPTPCRRNPPRRLERHCWPADSQGLDPRGGGVAHQEPNALHGAWAGAALRAWGSVQAHDLL